MLPLADMSYMHCSSSAISFGIILPYPSLAALLLSQPPLLLYSLVPLLLLLVWPCFWSALICFDFGHCPATTAHAQVRFYSSLTLYITYSLCPAVVIPSQCRADLPWHFPDLSWLCLPLGCLGPALTPHCSSLSPKSSLDCVCVMAWLF